MFRLADLREILHYVPQYRDKTFVIALDGALVGWSTFGSRAYYEVAKYFSGHTSSSSWWLTMNLETWMDFDAKTQGIIMAAAAKSEAAALDLAAKDDDKWIQLIKDKGGTVHIFTPEETTAWQTLTKPVYDEWIQISEKAGVGDQARQLMKVAGVPGF